MYDTTLLKDVLEDMIDATQKILNRCAKVECVDDFLDDEEGEILLDSICMLLIAIGEAVKEVDKITNHKLLIHYPQVEWQKVAGIRDILSHHYFDLNAETVFGVCEDKIAILHDTLQIIYDNEMK